MQALTGRFVHAFNRRDADGMIALSDPEITFYPTVLMGTVREYRGHEGMRRWLADLAKIDAKHLVHVRDVRPLDDRHFIVRSDVLLDGETVGDSAMMIRLTPAGMIAEGHTYLLDESHSLLDGAAPPRRGRAKSDEQKSGAR
jgi:SnoaL-like domain